LALFKINPIYQKNYIRSSFNFNSPHPTLWDEFGRVPEVLLEVGGDLTQTHDAGPSWHTVATQAHINLLGKSEQSIS
jgi:hypothetical protein